MSTTETDLPTTADPPDIDGVEAVVIAYLEAVGLTIESQPDEYAPPLDYHLFNLFIRRDPALTDEDEVLLLELCATFASWRIALGSFMVKSAVGT